MEEVHDIIGAGMVWYLLFSLVLNCTLIYALYYVYKLNKISFSKKQLFFICACILLIYGFYFISVLSRKFIYYWDFSCYYNIQLEQEDAFRAGLKRGLRYFADSTWSGEYSSFLNFVGEFLFMFTTKTADAYTLSNVVVFTPYLVFGLAILLKVIVKRWKLEKQRWFLPVEMGVLLSAPIFHMTLVRGQPDVFGYFFIFIILSLTIGYDFSKVDVKRWVGLILATFMLFISRRWYVFFILTLYLCYAVYVLVGKIKRKEEVGIILRNGLMFAGLMGGFFLVTLFPFIKVTLANNLNANYGAFYMDGGLKGELISQARYLGYLPLILITVGVGYGLASRKARTLTIFAIAQFALTLILFTRIQNMANHHLLLLLPFYTYATVLSFLAFRKVADKRIRYGLFAVAGLILAANVVATLDDKHFPRWFSNLSLRAPAEEDYDEIKEVTDWLAERLTDDDSWAYMIFHNSRFNPEKFRNFYLPDTQIRKHTTYGSSVLGTHKFPAEIFWTKYVLTQEPFVAYSVEETYNNVFLSLVEDEVFKEVSEFEMKDGTKIIAYERQKKLSTNEAERYLNALTPEMKNYPELYEDIIKPYVVEEK